MLYYVFIIVVDIYFFPFFIFLNFRYLVKCPFSLFFFLYSSLSLYDDVNTLVNECLRPFLLPEEVPLNHLKKAQRKDVDSFLCSFLSVPFIIHDQSSSLCLLLNSFYKISDHFFLNCGN